MKKLFFFALAVAVCGCKSSSEEFPTPTGAVPNAALAVDTTQVQPASSVEENEQMTKPADQHVKNEQVKYASFGDKITSAKAISSSEMLKKYKAMKKGDTLQVKFASVVREVCKKKGCWMSMQLPNDQESFVRFRDYGFFVPMNADNSEAIVSGKAYVDVVSVPELQHYAKDGGKSQEEIDAIKEPKVTYAFQADGVLIRE